MKRLLISLGFLLTMVSASFAAPQPIVSDECLTPAMVIDTFGKLAEESGDPLELVAQKDFGDGTSYTIFWNHKETVLAIIYGETAQGPSCAIAMEELTLAEFREITGIVLDT